MEEFESIRWPIGLREFMDKGKTKGFTEWEEFFKWYENDSFPPIHIFRKN